MAQIDDLALPLLPHVSQSARRHAAAALSDCAHAPPGLVRLLCEEDVEIAAPLLVRSPVLNEADLIALATRHGLPHARVIAKRADLGQGVLSVLEAMFVAKEQDVPPPAVPALEERVSLPSHSVENARRRLRGMMRSAAPAEEGKREGHLDLFTHLSDMALSDHQPFFETALADALGLGLTEARRIAATSGTLLFALHTLDLKPEQVFLILAVVCPEAVSGKTGIRWVLERCAELDGALGGAARAGNTIEQNGPSASLLPFRRAQSL